MFNNQGYARKRKSPRILTYVVLILLVLGLSMTVVTESIVISKKTISSKLSNQISDAKASIETLNTENDNLKNSIDEQQKLYAEKMKDAKIAYLTFDDGPSHNTETILKVLKDNGVKATFFVNGHEEYKDLYKKILEDGNVLANHTYSHNYTDIYSSVDSFKKDINKLEKFVEENTGTPMAKLIRYPGGSNNSLANPQTLQNIVNTMDTEGYSYFDWNVDSTDATGHNVPKQNLVNNVLNQSKNVHKAVILMHDSNTKDTTAEALPEIIQGLKNEGFVFDVLSKDSVKPQFLTVK